MPASHQLPPRDLTLTRAQVRAVDQIALERFHMPGVILMENAGRNCAELLLQQPGVLAGPVCICCGSGNNGGDGFVIARHLNAHGVPVELLTLHDPSRFAPDALQNFRIVQAAGLPIRQFQLPHDTALFSEALKNGAWVVDALLGTGATGAVRDPYRSAIQAINAVGKPVFSVDIPSGMDCDTGDSGDCGIVATVTATLVAWKPAFSSLSGKAMSGRVSVLPIGLPAAVLELAKLKT